MVGREQLQTQLATIDTRHNVVSFSLNNEAPSLNGVAQALVQPHERHEHDAQREQVNDDNGYVEHDGHETIERFVAVAPGTNPTHAKRAATVACRLQSSLTTPNMKTPDPVATAPPALQTNPDKRKARTLGSYQRNCKSEARDVDKDVVLLQRLQVCKRVLHRVQQVVRKQAEPQLGAWANNNS
jgi:hypothetical protein